MKPIGETFAANLLRFRLARGLSQSEVALLSGLSMQYVSYLENGRRWPTPTVIHKLAKALKVRPTDLFSLQDPGDD